MDGRVNGRIVHKFLRRKQLKTKFPPFPFRSHRSPLEQDNICVPVCEGVSRFVSAAASFVHRVEPPKLLKRVAQYANSLLRSTSPDLRCMPAPPFLLLRRQRGANHLCAITSDHRRPPCANSRWRLMPPVQSACGESASGPHNQTQAAARSHGAKLALSAVRWGCGGRGVGCY